MMAALDGGQAADVQQDCSEQDDEVVADLHSFSSEVKMTPSSGRRITAQSPIDFFAAREAEHVHHHRHKSPPKHESIGLKLHKRSPNSQREARNQSRILELEDAVDELEKKLRLESTEKHELALQIRKMKAGLSEQEQLRATAEEEVSELRQQLGIQEEGWERVRKELTARANLLAEEKRDLVEEIQIMKETKRRCADDHDSNMASARRENALLSKRACQTDTKGSPSREKLKSQVLALQGRLDEANAEIIRLQQQQMMASMNEGPQGGTAAMDTMLRQLNQERVLREGAEARLEELNGRLHEEADMRAQMEAALHTADERIEAQSALATGVATQVAELKEMLAERDAKLDTQRKRIASLEPWQGAGAEAREEMVKEIVDAGKAKAALKAAVDDNKILNDELDRNAVELGKLEKRLARGEYNAAFTRVLVPKTMVPCTACVTLRAQLASACAERDAVKGMLESAQAAAGNILNTDHSVEFGESSLEAGLKIADLHRALAEKDKYISRLSEQAKAQIQEYKEVAKALFGYSLSKHKSTDERSRNTHGQYQVKSLFALKSSDVILVQAQDGGRQVDMLTTDYSVRLKGHADRFFAEAGRFPPLPALLASITIEHYARCVS